MEKHKIWGLATLMLLLGIAAVFLFIDKDTETEPEMTLGQPTKDLLKQGVKLPQQAETPGAVEELPPVVPPNEHPSVPYRHEDDTVHNLSVSQVSQTYNGPLTYHAELLETNPVKALRLQAEERGHWSAQWIPPFPPDDQEAADFARSRYLYIYYKSIRETGTPEFLQLEIEIVSQQDVIRAYPKVSARGSDLLRLGWSTLDADAVVTGFQPSNYSLPLK